MSGETHINTSICCGMLLFQPTSIQELAMGTGLLVLGATLPDIDIASSRARKQAIKIRAYIIVVLALMAAIYNQLGINLFAIAALKYGNSPVVVAVVIFIALCIYGNRSRHRTFTHSILGAGIMSACIGVLIGVESIKYFAIGYVSHILLDILNEKPVYVLYPVNKGISLNICKSSGIVDKITFYVCGIITLILLFIRFTNISFI